jgi:hypothetical protein
MGETARLNAAERFIEAFTPHFKAFEPLALPEASFIHLRSELGIRSEDQAVVVTHVFRAPEGDEVRFVDPDESPLFYPDDDSYDDVVQAACWHFDLDKQTATRLADQVDP